MSKNLAETEAMVEPTVDEATTTEQPNSAAPVSTDDVINVAEAAPQQDYSGPDALPDVDPGRKLGVIGIVAALLGPVGIVLGFVAFRKSRAVGFGGTMGTLAMVAGTVITLLVAVFLIMQVTGMGFGGACEGRGPGLHVLEDGTRISCS